MNYLNKTFNFKQLLIALGVLLVIGFVFWENTKTVSFSDIRFDTPEAQEAGIRWVDISIGELQNRAQQKSQQAVPANPM